MTLGLAQGQPMFPECGAIYPLQVDSEQQLGQIEQN